MKYYTRMSQENAPHTRRYQVREGLSVYFARIVFECDVQTLCQMD